VNIGKIIDYSFPLAQLEWEKQFLRKRNFIDNAQIAKNIRIAVSVPVGQRVIASGELKQQYTSGNRSHFEYHILNAPLFFAVYAANQQMLTAKSDGVEINLYYTSKHRNGAEKLLKIAQQTIHYGVEQFGKLPYSVVNIVEMPYRAGGSCFGNLIVLEESYFVSDFADTSHLIQSNIIMAHEIAHLWWAGTLQAANIRGARVLYESLAEYTAIEMIPVFQSEEFQNIYLERLKQQYEQEYFSDQNPTSLMESSSEHYLLYKKGALVFHYLKTHMGEEQLNDILRTFIEKNRNQYARLEDLIDAILNNIPDPTKDHVEELFYDNAYNEYLKIENF
jgi:ABC-2 type transport system permease protein